MEVPVIDGYSDLIQVARGGFGFVYRARQDRFGRTVALKVLNVADLDDRGQQRFERECIAMGSLGWHPNVVAVFDSGITDDGHPWLSMEYLDGGSLGDRLRQGPLPWQEVVIAGVQVAGALDAAHTAGILHRDLKPENLLVGPYQEVKLGDFGIAAVEGAARTTTGHASFTANHVAPEILRRQRPSERSDLYSLASTLHTLIAGAPPFAGDPDEPIEAIITSVLTAPPPRLQGVPEDLADLLERTLGKDPADRPASAQEFGATLQSIQADNGQRATDLRLAPTITPVAASSGGAMKDKDSTPRHAKPEPPGSEPRATVDKALADPVADDLRPSTEPTPRIADSPQGDPRPTIALNPPAIGSADLRPTVQKPPLEPQSLAVHNPDSHPPAPEGQKIDNDGTTGSGAPGPRRNGRRMIAIAVAILLAGIATGATVLTVRRDDGADGTDTTGPTSSVPSETNSIVDTIDLDSPPDSAAATSADLWVVNGRRTDGRGTVTRIDLETNEIIDTISLDPFAVGVTATSDAVWVTNSVTNTLSRIDTLTNEVTATVDVGANPNGVAASGNSVWVANSFGASVSRVDRSTNRVVATVPVSESPTGIAANRTAVWVTQFGGRTLSRIDPATNQVVATIDVGRGPVGVAATRNAVWVSNTSDGTVARIDPATNEVAATIAVGDSTGELAATDDAVWVVSYDDSSGDQVFDGAGHVSRIDPASNEATVFVDLTSLGAIAATTNAVWVGSGASIVRLDT